MDLVAIPLKYRPVVYSKNNKLREYHFSVAYLTSDLKIKTVIYNKKQVSTSRKT